MAGEGRRVQPSRRPDRHAQLREPAPVIEGEAAEVIEEGRPFTTGNGSSESRA